MDSIVILFMFSARLKIGREERVVRSLATVLLVYFM